MTETEVLFKGKIFERCNRRVYKAAEQIMQIGDYRSG